MQYQARSDTALANARMPGRWEAFVSRTPKHAIWQWSANPNQPISDDSTVRGRWDVTRTASSPVASRPQAARSSSTALQVSAYV